ncbi:adenosylmethionine decarboxylase [Massilia solisilvae]|uniref:S-adenosylmethionine decarboxylase proenzyme n=1 Tax=Massilia solisilvae TaxID=1811225 RepID=A0ABT2BIX0_9BURK|nr:adenosylmethionine decarboxylase [Massilia solisilvae]
MNRDFRPAGQHLLADLQGIETALLQDPSRIDDLLRAAALAAGARVLHGHFHTFGEGMGVTGVLLLAESHISIHTWPESRFAAVDIFMCGQAQPERALQVIDQVLQPLARNVRIVERGQL